MDRDDLKDEEQRARVYREIDRRPVKPTLPAWAYPDAEGTLEYPHPLGHYGAAKTLHITSADPWAGPACGANAVREFRMISYSRERRPVCTACRKEIALRADVVAKELEARAEHGDALDDLGSMDYVHDGQADPPDSDDGNAATHSVCLTLPELRLLRSALESHAYWEIGDEDTRNDGYFRDDWCDPEDPEQAEQLGAYAEVVALEAKLIAAEKGPAAGTRSMWIVHYWHRYGADVWPVFDEAPTIASVQSDLGREGVEVEIDRDDEAIEIHGPFEVPA